MRLADIPGKFDPMAELNQDNTPVVWFGGTFDPVHNGHLVIARCAAEQVKAGKVVLAPARCNPLKNSPAASPGDRVKMLKIAVEGDPLFEIDRAEINRRGPSYTVDTIEHTMRKRKNKKMYLLAGADSLNELTSWHRVEDLLQMVTLLVACRPPADIEQVNKNIAQIGNILRGKTGDRLNISAITAPMLEISSTDIRRRVNASRSIKYLVPETVEDYIEKRALYRDK